MPDGAWISALVAVVLFLFTHAGITIWWASRVNTLLDVVQRQLTDIVVELKATRHTYVSKEEFAYRVSTADKEHAAMWGRIDELKERG